MHLALSFMLLFLPSLRSASDGVPEVPRLSVQHFSLKQLQVNTGLRPSSTEKWLPLTFVTVSRLCRKETISPCSGCGLQCSKLVSSP